jgi:hypothetical protein
MKRNVYIGLGSLLLVGATTASIHIYAQQPSKPKSMSDCPMMKQMSDMIERGEKGMGFSQTKTTHHFYLSKAGGIIQVEANDEIDQTSRDQIRLHLGHIARMFSEGNFDIPMFVHDQVPPGVPEMKKMKAVISYEFEETKGGGRVRISSSDSQALAAIHNFLRFQITEHKTGDPLED